MTPMITGITGYVAGFQLNLFTKGEEYELESYFLRQTVTYQQTTCLEKFY